MGKLISSIYQRNSNTYPARAIGEAMPKHIFMERMSKRPILRKIGKVWELYCDYHDRAIPKTAGFAWSPTQKVWFTDNPKKALALIKYAEKYTKNHLLEEFASLPE